MDCESFYLGFATTSKTKDLKNQKVSFNYSILDKIMNCSEMWRKKSLEILKLKIHHVLVLTNYVYLAQLRIHSYVQMTKEMIQN